VFRNIASKLKTAAGVLFALGAVGSVIGGILLMTRSLIAVGLVVLIGGMLLSWLCSIFVYGFGQLIENTDRTAPRRDVPQAGNAVYDPAEGAKPFGNEQNGTIGEGKPYDPFENAASGTCQLCGKENVKIISCKIVDDMGTRYRSICADCMQRKNAEPTR